MLDALRTIHSAPTVKELAEIMSLSQCERSDKSKWGLGSSYGVLGGSMVAAMAVNFSSTGCR